MPELLQWSIENPRLAQNKEPRVKWVSRMKPGYFNFKMEYRRLPCRVVRWQQ